MTGVDTTRLAVPDAACDALHAATGREREDARAVAAPVVAAELRRLAVESFRNGELGDTLRARMVVRADEVERARDGETSWSTETRRDNAGLDARIEAEERAVIPCEMCDEIGEPHVCERAWWRQRLAHMKRQECADEECLCHAAADAMREALQLQAMVRGNFRR